MPLSHAQTIATKGWLNNNAVTFVSKGYIYIKIEEIPVPTPKSKIGGLPDEDKIIKVTVKYKGREYIQAKLINSDIRVNIGDINIKVLPKVIIEINIKGIKIDIK